MYFTVLDLYEVYFPLSNIELMSSAHISITFVLGVTPGANEEW